MTLAEATMFAVAGCVRCGSVFTFDPETVPSVWVNIKTQCPNRTDGAPIVAGEDGTAREPLCPPCAALMRRYNGQPGPLLELFPLARIDRIHPAGT